MFRRYWFRARHAPILKKLFFQTAPEAGLAIFSSDMGEELGGKAVSGRVNLLQHNGFGSALLRNND